MPANRHLFRAGFPVAEVESFKERNCTPRSPSVWTVTRVTWQTGARRRPLGRRLSNHYWEHAVSTLSRANGPPYLGDTTMKTTSTVSSILATTALALFTGCGAGHEESEVTGQVSEEIEEGNSWGNRDFELTSPEFVNGDAMPYAHTCEGQIFGSGTTPHLQWTKAFPGVHTYALVLVDTTLIDQPQFAFHWAAWNIPQTVHDLPEALEDGQFPEALKGGEQLRPGPVLRYFAPCPSWRTYCWGWDRITDSYEFRLYAFDEQVLSPPTTSVADVDAYLAEHAESLTTLEFTSDAAPTAFPRACPPPPAE